jgi:hypothetical protein
VYCGVLSAGLALGWAAGFQELRYLLPICAPLSLATAVVLRAALDRVQWRWVVRPALVGASVIALGLVILHVGADRPVQVLLGHESVDHYWRQSITTGATYRATQFLAERRQPGDTVLWFNDAQVYYVSYPVRPDHLDLNLILLMSAHPAPADALAALQAEHVDYLLVNEANIRYRERFDPEGRLQEAQAAFDRLIPLLTPIYRDGPAGQPSIVVYQVPRAPQASTR